MIKSSKKNYPLLRLSLGFLLCFRLFLAYYLDAFFLCAVQHLDTLKKELAYLSLSRKLVLFSSIFTFLFLFFPWGTRGVRGDGGFDFVAKSFSAFGVFPIFGWVLLFLIACSLFLLFSEMISKKTSRFGLSHSVLWLFLGIVGVYSVFLALFVLNSGYLKSFDSRFSLKIGIFLALFMQSLLVFGGYIGRKDEEKNYVKEALSRPHEVDTSKAHLAPEETDQMSLADYDH